MNDVVYLDYNQCVKLFKQASENNGRVILEAKGFIPFEVIVDPEYAKRIWSEEKSKLELLLNEFKLLPDNALSRELIDILREESIPWYDLL